KALKSPCNVVSFLFKPIEYSNSSSSTWNRAGGEPVLSRSRIRPTLCGGSTSTGMRMSRKLEARRSLPSSPRKVRSVWSENATLALSSAPTSKQGRRLFLQEYARLGFLPETPDWLY
uniref:Pentatricopeptide repeat-containing protein n=1 Tax=Mesocestoides corti TaxID=53468 RepID=A0A5K3FBC5_MESCO